MILTTYESAVQGAMNLGARVVLNEPSDRRIDEPSPTRRCSALAGREPLRVTICPHARHHLRAIFHRW
jgi:hypothetical protein